MSWKKTLGVFDARLASRACEHGTKLRHWREIVARVHADFEANLPDAELPNLAVQAAWVDGRTEGSRYPNLLLPGMGERYGIS